MKHPAPSPRVRKKVIGVMGGHESEAAAEALAQRLGAAIAAEGWITLTGGNNEGVMAAATKGARDAGGLTIGLHPGTRHDGNVADADIIVYTSIGYARNAMNVLSSDVVIALPGFVGTLSEVAFAINYNVPAILLKFEDGGWFGNRVKRADTVEQAIRMAKDLL